MTKYGCLTALILRPINLPVIVPASANSTDTPAKEAVPIDSSYRDE
jgi:hypothetical protein